MFPRVVCLSLLSPAELGSHLPEMSCDALSFAVMAHSLVMFQSNFWCTMCCFFKEMRFLVCTQTNEIQSMFSELNWHEIQYDGHCQQCSCSFNEVAKVTTLMRGQVWMGCNSSVYVDWLSDSSKTRENGIFKLEFNSLNEVEMTIISFIFANLKFGVAYNYHLCLSVSSLFFSSLGVFMGYQSHLTLDFIMS